MSLRHYCRRFRLTSTCRNSSVSSVCSFVRLVTFVLLSVSCGTHYVRGGNTRVYREYHAGPYSHQYVEQNFGRHSFLDSTQDIKGHYISNSDSYNSVLDKDKDTYSDKTMGSSKRNLCMLLGLCFQVVNSYHQHFQVMHGWNKLEYDYPLATQKQIDISSGYYVPGLGAPIDVDVYYAPNQPVKTFVTIPRFLAGLPVTLGTISDKTSNGNPVITPYPNWNYQRTVKKPTSPNVCNPDRVVSVFRVKIDECGRLWVLDAGRVGDDLICPPQILAFDLKTNARIVKYELPTDQYESRSIFVTPTVDVVSTANLCVNTFVYLADCQTFSIVVFDQAKMRSWRIIDKTFYPYPNYGTFNIQGESFDLMDGILGMDLEPKYSGMPDRKLFYHALSAGTENWVYTSYLKDESRFASDPYSSPGIFNTYPLSRPSQSAAIAIDRNGIAFFGNMGDTTMLCWNTRTPYWGPYTDVIEQNATTLQFPAGVKVVTNTHGNQEVWILTNSFQKVAAQTLSSTQHNFRILAGYTSDLLNGSKCVNYVK